MPAIVPFALAGNVNNTKAVRAALLIQRATFI